MDTAQAPCDLCRFTSAEAASVPGRVPRATITRMQQTYRYFHVDVFTNRPLTGNQLAVFLDMGSEDPELMQRIALEMAFSETTFVFPPQQPETDYRVRIFTPRSELPTAGHPTIGTTFALTHAKRITKRPAIRLGMGIGPVPVALEWEDDRLLFAWMTQPTPQFGPMLKDMAGIAAALGLNAADIEGTNLPVQVLSSGNAFLYVPLVARRTVNAAELNRRALLHICQSAGIPELSVFVFTLEGGEEDNATVFSRMFAPGFGVSEDPATGSASGPLGAYLVKYGAISPGSAAHIVSRQGVKLGRPSEIHISIGMRGDEVREVRVGGQAVVLGKGMLTI